MFITTRGLILREVTYKEADKILTVLTEDEGKKTIKARGALRPRSKIAAAAQFLTFSDMTIFVHKDLWTINEAVALEQFNGLRSDIVSLALASYFAEVLEAVTDEDYPDPTVLQLGLNSLYALSEKLCPRELIKAAFEMRLMCLSGYEPDLSACSVCGVTEFDTAYINPQNFAVSCDGCRDEKSVAVSGAVLRAMRHIISAEAKKVFSFEIDGASLKVLGAICEKYLLRQLDRPFGSLEYYKKMAR